MPHSRSTSAILDGRFPHGQKAMLHACLWILASLVTAVAILGLTWMIAARNEREAGRMMVEAQQGKGYVATVVSGFAEIHGRPKGF